MNTTKIIFTLLLVSLFSCKNIRNKKRNVLKVNNKETSRSIQYLNENKKSLANMTFYGITKSNDKWVLNDYCGGGSQRIKITTTKIYHYIPIEETPYTINSFNKNDNWYRYNATSDFGGKKKIYIFEYNSNSGILILHNKNVKMKYFISSNHLYNVQYIRAKCENCYEKSDCDKWRRNGSLKKNKPFGYPE